MKVDGRRGTLEGDGMEVIFGYETALEYWRRRMCFREGLPPAPRRGGWPHRLPSEQTVVEIAERILGVKGSRPHALVVDKRAWKRMESVDVHILKTPLPRGAVLRIDSSCSVVSPELCFAQIAQREPFEKLLQIGFELCGSFSTAVDSTDPDAELGCFPVKNVTSAKSLARWAGLLAPRKGTGAMRKVSGHIVDGTASPMEAVTAMLLCLPCRLGGYGIPQPVANCRIDLTARSFTIAGTYWFCEEGEMIERHGLGEFRVCDLFWPKTGVAVEYDGQSGHSSRRQRAKDAQRRLDLEARGVSLITVTSGQVLSFARMEQVAKEVSSALGHRLQRRDLGLTEERARLRKELLRPGGWAF